MTTQQKSVQLLVNLQDNTELLDHAERVELKRTRSGHWRLFVACLPNTTTAAAEGVDGIANANGYTANPYRRADQLTSVSFADNEEPPRSRG